MGLFSLSLLEYTLICGVIAAVFWEFNRKFFIYRDLSRHLDLPNCLELPDPYLLAFMRGGKNEMIRTIIIGLTLREYLAVDTRSDKVTISCSSSPPSISELTSIERMVFGYFSQEGAQPVKDIYGCTELPFLVSSYTGQLEEKLYRKRLLTTDYEYALAQELSLVGLALVMIISLMQEDFSWWFVVIGIYAWRILLESCLPEKVNDLGRRYLESLKGRFPLSQRLNGFRGRDNFTLMVIVSLFGMEALEDTSFIYFQEVFEKAYKTTSAAEVDIGCGAGCGGGGGGGGGCGGG